MTELKLKVNYPWDNSFVERHPGHGSQKAHGFRYGGGSSGGVDVSTARKVAKRIEDKDTRKEYLSRVRDRSGETAYAAGKKHAKAEQDNPFDYEATGDQSRERDKKLAPTRNKAQKTRKAKEAEGKREARRVDDMTEGLKTSQIISKHFKKQAYQVKTMDRNGDPKTIDKQGYVSGDFGVEKNGNYATVTHIPTGTRVGQFGGISESGLQPALKMALAAKNIKGWDAKDMDKIQYDVGLPVLGAIRHFGGRM